MPAPAAARTPAVLKDTHTRKDTLKDALIDTLKDALKDTLEDTLEDTHLLRSCRHQLRHGHPQESRAGKRNRLAIRSTYIRDI